MKILLSSVLGMGFVTVISSVAFAQCGHDDQSASLSSLVIASEINKPQEAMSTHDPVVIKDLIGEVKSTESGKKVSD